MAANITVNWDTLKAKSDSVFSESTEMETTLGEIKTEIVNLNNTWQSNASEQMIDYMNGAMNTAFIRYKEVLDEYAKFLGEASTTYSEAENRLVSEANNLLDFK